LGEVSGLLVMNILITGAGGFIGSHLSKVLAREHKTYLVFSGLKAEGNPDSIAVDLTDKSLVHKRFSDLSKQINIDAIFHLASCMASPDQTENVELLKDNIAITESIITIAKLLKPSVLINCSSMAVYPNISGTFSENSVPGPQKNQDCLYGLSKYCTEVMIDFLLRKESIRIVHLRISQVHGEGMQEDRIIPVMLKELQKSNAITVYGDGERTSNFIEIRKLTKELQFFLKKDVTGVYNIGDHNISYGELAQTLVEQHGDNSSVINKKPQGNKEKYILDMSKLDSIHKL
jgi:nucleoside-diphosphate-sugar epimerase